MDEKTKARYLGDIEYFSTKLELDKTSMLFIPLASAHLNLRQYEEAKRVIFDGLDANPDVAMAKTMLAQAYIGLEQMEDAKGLLTEIRVLDSANYLAEKLLGDIYAKESEYKKAIISYRNAYNSAPEYAELKDLIEKMMSESGLDADELLDDRPMRIDEEEMLDTLGQELADEVRNEIGETKQQAASDEEVKKTVEEIVGQTEDESLDIYAEEDSSMDASEIEEESLASIEDEIVPTKSIINFADLVGDEDIEDGDIGASCDISGMAAELSNELGLTLSSDPFAEEHADDSVSYEPSDTEETDTAADEEFMVEIPEDIMAADDIEEKSEETDPSVEGLGNIEVSDFADSFGEMLSTDEDGQPQEQPQEQIDEQTDESIEDALPADFSMEGLVPEDMADMFAQEPVAPEQAEDIVAEEAEAPAAEDFDLSEFGDMADFDGIVAEESSEKTEEPEQETEIEAEKEPEPEPEVETAEETVIDGFDDIETVEPEETAAEIEEDEPVIDVQSEEIVGMEFSPDEVSELQEELAFDDEPVEEIMQSEEPEEIINMSPEDEKIISEAKKELVKEEKINEELAILFAMEELEEKARSGEDKEHVSAAADDLLADVKSRYPEGLDDETYEQVSRLENLLEIIKNNAK